MKTLLRYTFPDGLDKESIESLIALVIQSAGQVAGMVRVRLSGFGYYISQEKSQIILDIPSRSAEQLAEIFTELLIEEVGELSFQVERVSD